MDSTAHEINSSLLNLACKAQNNLCFAYIYCFITRLLPLSMLKPGVTAFIYLFHPCSHLLVVQYPCHKLPLPNTFHPLTIKFYQKSFLIPQIWVRGLNYAFSFSFHSSNFNRKNIIPFTKTSSIPWYHFF